MNHCNICDIAFEERYCPLCESKEEVIRLSKELEDANDEIVRLLNNENKS